MNLDNLEQILPYGYVVKNFNDVEQVAKIEHNFGDTLVSKYVIDLKSDYSDIDIQEYQEKFISKDYFDTDGNAQWNYYLIFVRESFNTDAKRAIEKDESYARKFVFTSEELRDYLRYQQSDVEKDEDVVTRWKQQLTAVELQEVFSDEPYNQAVPRFVEGKAKKLDELSSIDSKPIDSEDFVLERVKNLNLRDSYRDFPEKRNFALGKVNLITGPNGVGKTSLMEGLELVITGNNSRNISADKQNDCVAAEYSSNGQSVSDTYTNSLTKYKARDYFWYNNPIGRFNEAYRSFNRYNFYNSDSAYRLSNNPNIEELTKYLTAIALGTEFGSIRNRLIGFQERLDQEQKRIYSIIIQEEEIKTKSEAQIEKLKKISDPDVLFNQFIEDAKSVKWQKPLPQTPKDKTELFEQDYKTLLSYLNSIVHSKVVSESDALDRLKELNKLKNNLNKKENEKDTSRKNLKTLQSKLKEIKTQKDLIDSALKYLESPNSFRIRSLNKEIKQLEQGIKRFDSFDTNIKKINLNAIGKSPKTIKQLTQDYEHAKNEKENKKVELQGQRETLKSTLDKLKSVIAEIRYYGKEFIETRGDDVDACPLCETPHTKSQLLQKVERIYDEEGEAKKIEGYNKSINKLEKEILDISNELKAFRNYENSLKNILLEEDLEKSLNDINTILHQKREEIDAQRNQIEELKALDIDLRSAGFSEDELDDLEKNITTAFSELHFTKDSKANFETFRKDLIIQIEEIQGKIGTNTKKIDELDSEIKELVEGKYELDDYNSEIAFDIKELQSFLELFDNIKEIITIQPKDFVVEVRHSAERVFEKFKSLKSLLVKFEELHLANNLIRKAEERIKAQTEKLDRVKSGLEVINDILTKDSREKILELFFRKNEEEISEIFARIHSPKEFTGLSMDSGKIHLQKGLLGTATPINEISTGQRSALALSIFLALNRKLKKGPNIIIFDDPVTYTDDLNILSFLDYLRTLIINESRQLVFATASKKIAGLFEKKFNFLNDEFKTFELSRTDY
tara:strand:+ start:57337 stop:60399 length:3063 start_codon:yes stop_codon:yes gene_type:complete